MSTPGFWATFAALACAIVVAPLIDTAIRDCQTKTETLYRLLTSGSGVAAVVLMIIPPILLNSKTPSGFEIVAYATLSMACCCLIAVTSIVTPKMKDRLISAEQDAPRDAPQVKVGTPRRVKK